MNWEDDLAEAIENVVYDFETYSDAETVVKQAQRFEALMNSVFDLSTYHPRYSDKTGKIEREEE